VVVDDTQLSLAIGRRGRTSVAAKLLGWKIDIKESEEEKRQKWSSRCRRWSRRPPLRSRVFPAWVKA